MVTGALSKKNFLSRFLWEELIHRATVIPGTSTHHHIHPRLRTAWDMFNLVCVILERKLSLTAF